MEWMTERPTQPGFYWFIGVPWGTFNLDRVAMYYVAVVQTSNSLAFICSGNFMDNTAGLWQAVRHPELPYDGIKIATV